MDFFLTKNSSVVLIFSFLKIFPAFPHESKNKSINVNKLIFSKKPFVIKTIIPNVINISAILKINQ